MKNKKVRLNNLPLDIAVLAGAPLLAAAVSLLVRVDFLLSTFLFFGVPAAYLSWRKKRQVPRMAIFAACFSLAGLYADYMAEKDLNWAEPHSVLHFRFAGVVPIESVVWFFLMTYLIISFYEYFFDKSTHAYVGRKMSWLFIILTIASMTFLVPLLAARPLTINYFYLKMGIVLGVIPLAAFLSAAPRFLSIFLKTAPYFLALSLLNEFVGLHNGYWDFPGTHFIGWVHLAGLKFPYEELIFWMILFSSVVIAYFEFFDDNRLRFHSLLHRSSK